jgi:hypothetical protein
MPLHDWDEIPGWDGVHLLWIAELLHWLKPRLPEGYRAYIGTSPTFAIGAPVEERPHVGVRTWSPGEREPSRTNGPCPNSEVGWEPEQEIAIATVSADRAVLVDRHGLLIAAVELVSPRNKDRTSAQATYAGGYAGYLLKGVHLLLVDVHRRPLHFSFADRLAGELGLDHPPLAAPFAASYQVGEPGPRGGRLVSPCRRALTVGQPLPVLPLALSVFESVVVDLEQTYARAAEAAYLS